MSAAALESTINTAFDARDGISSATKGEVRDAVDHALDLLDKGEARVAEREGNGKWKVHQCVDRRRSGQGVVVGQGAVEVRRLGRKPLS